jgi:uncharacterized LabA/DUF88 family protein
MNPNWILLIDHDNIPLREGALSAIISCWLASVPAELRGNAIQELLVRSYGGWWQEESQSTSRYKAGPFYADECPALVRVADHYWRVHFEFADYLLSDEEHSALITHTFALRPAPHLFFATSDGRGCDEYDCEAKKLRRWLMSRRGCTRLACPRAFGDLWMKPEQKQVDIHLAVDLLDLCSRRQAPRRVGLVSDDTDFLPAILASATSKSEEKPLITLIRFTGKPSYLDTEIGRRGVEILNLDTFFGGR